MILRGTKPIEYRSRKTNIRERAYIYASLTPGGAEDFGEIGVLPGTLPTGLIIGSVEITDCTEDDGDFEWHLAKPERLKTSLTRVLHLLR